MILIITFYLSLALISFMLWTKRSELATGRRSLVSRLGEGSDHFFHKLDSDVREAVSYFNKHTLVAFLQWSAAHVLLWFRDFYIKLYRLAHRHPHTKKVIDMVRGQGQSADSSGASFFLKKISDLPAMPAHAGQAGASAGNATTAGME